MPMRYACYRMPNGKPYQGDDAKYAPAHLLSYIGKTASAHSDGRISWRGIEMTWLNAALRHAFVVTGPDGVELNETDTWNIIWKALLAVVRKAPDKKIDPIVLRGAMNNLAADFFRTPLAAYILVSSLSVAQLHRKNIRVQKCIIAPLKGRGSKYPVPESALAPIHRRHIEKSKYTVVRVDVKGRSIYDAAEKAIAALDLLRALWSVSATLGSWHMTFASSERRPLGVIHIGPIHTLHLPNGKLVRDDLYWCESSYDRDRPIVPADAKWVRCEKNRQWAMRRLRALPHRSEIETLLIRYVRALDRVDMDLAFLQIWSILERMTDTVGGNYDETIKRRMSHP